MSLSKNDKNKLCEYFHISQSVDKLDNDYTIEDLCTEFHFTKNEFLYIHNLAKKYFKKKHIILID